METQNNILEFIKRIKDADAILVGAASGMSSASGFNHYYHRSEEFVRYFKAYENKYGFHNTFDGFYYPYKSDEERMAYLSQMLTCISDEPIGQTYLQLLEILKDKEFHILTTNQDAQFNKILTEDKISAIQGDWRYLQCGKGCTDKLYSSQRLIDLNKEVNSNLTIDKSLVLRCKYCNAPLEPWVRGPYFIEGKRYKEEYIKVNEFLTKYQDKKLVLLELGVGRMTPMFIQQPFWNLTYTLPYAYYITINPKDALLPQAIANKGLKIKEDIKTFFDKVLKEIDK